MNRVILTGRLTKDIDLRSTPNGKHVARFNIAVRRDDRTADFPTCVAWGKTAELLQRYCHKGSLIGVDGKIKTSNYQKDGKDVYKTEIEVSSVEFLSSKDNNTKNTENDGNGTQNEPQFDNPDTWGVGIDNDDLPF